MTGLAVYRPATPAELRDPAFRSYAKCLAIGEKPLSCACGECGNEALIMPALTMKTPSTGTLICPTCWHPVVGRLLLGVVAVGGRALIRRKQHREVARMLADLGLLKRLHGWNYALTPAGMAVLWVKERVGWEFERAHARGWYRTERLNGDYAAGYWSNEGTTGQWIHHRWEPASKVWPIGGVGVLHFGVSA